MPPKAKAKAKGAAKKRPAGGLGKKSPRALLFLRRATLAHYPQGTLRVGDHLIGRTAALVDGETCDAIWEILEISNAHLNYATVELKGVSQDHIEAVKKLLTENQHYPVPLRLQAHFCGSKSCDVQDEGVHITHLRLLKQSELIAAVLNMDGWKRDAPPADGKVDKTGAAPAPEPAGKADAADDQLGLGDLAKDLGLGGQKSIDQGGQLAPLPP